MNPNGTGPYLSREFRFIKARKTEKVEIPELGCVIILRELSVKQMAQIDRGDLVGQLAMMIIDESGDTMFTSPADLANLAEMSATVSTKLFEAMNRLAATTQTAQEEVLKN